MKITILGRGNAGCISAMHFAHFKKQLNTKIDIELIYDSSIPPVPTGQGTTLSFPERLFENFGASYLTNFPYTIKTGIMYENFGKKNKKIYHNFPLGTYALHFEPKQFQDYVCNNLKINFKETDENIHNLDSIDSDYIVDCRGTPKNLDNYDKLHNPLNTALLGSLPKKENDVLWTRSIAHNNGWCFYIPLPQKTSLGYLFNKNITSVVDAKKDFKKTFGVTEAKEFSFNQYVAKEPIIDNRVLLNGNRLFFLEPLEATAMGMYIQTARFYYDYIFNNTSKYQTGLNIKDHVNKVQNFILWHYANGSTYKSKFWNHAKNIWDENKDEDFLKLLKIIKGMTKEDIENSVHTSFKYAQWKEWNLKLWQDQV